MYKFLLIFLTAVLLSANAQTYNIKFKGIKLGEIANLSTLKDNYLHAKVTNPIARFFVRHRNFVFYSKDRPNIEDAKFKKDKNMLLFAFYKSITDRPKHHVYVINDLKSLTLDCSCGECRFIYEKKGEVKGKGRITFDKDGQFTKLKEEISSVEISK